MLSYHEFSTKLQELKIPAGVPLIAHASLSAFGHVRGGAETILGSLFSVTDRLMLPAFTFRTMIIPEDGPADNGLEYGSGKSTNAMAEFYTSDMPADRLVGTVAENFRTMPTTKRSLHPILSFCGVNLDEALATQTLDDPLAPVDALSKLGGWVVLLGVDHTCNTSIHLAEKLADRKQFVRWALTPSGITACAGFPGCSDGFNKISPVIQDITHRTNLGTVELQAIPIHFLVDIARAMMIANPQALLCDRPDCPRCNAIRKEWGT
jgi:aminoglycoside 3-N-acetyltransferase